MFDAAHMLKLIRNALVSKHILYDGDDNAVKFQYFEKLVELQEAGHFHLANKVTKKHILWYKNKMNVKLAAQTFSESCAVALEQLLEDSHANFKGCAATIKFCRMMNNTFDVLNSRSLFSNGFKRPLKHNTVTEMFLFFQKL